jgi:hypothetical protein
MVLLNRIGVGRESLAQGQAVRRPPLASSRWTPSCYCAWQARVFAVTVLLASAIAAPGTSACGYENPSDMALGLLNWIYPNALYVRTAVWKAEDAGILAPRSSNTAKDLFGGGFRRAAASMYGLGKRIEHFRSRDRRRSKLHGGSHSCCNVDALYPDCRRLLRQGSCERP